MEPLASDILVEVPGTSTLPSQSWLQAVWLLLKAVPDSKGTAGSSSANFTLYVAGHRQRVGRAQHNPMQGNKCWFQAVALQDDYSYKSQNLKF